MAAGLFRDDVDPIQLYVSITAMSYFHVSNRYTLSAMFDKDLGDPDWLELRRAHAQDVILTWLTAAASEGKRKSCRRNGDSPQPHASLDCSGRILKTAPFPARTRKVPTSAGRNDAVAARIARALKQSIRMPDDRAGVAHELLERANRLNLVAEPPQ